MIKLIKMIKMKKKIWFFTLMLLGFVLILNVSCKKVVVTTPVVTTTEASNVTKTTAVCGGNISDDGGEDITERGFCYSTEVNPTISNNKISIGTGIGNFSGSLTGLTTFIKYYVRAFATNSAGTGYGSEIMFMTIAPDIVFNPNLTYGTITDIDGNVYKTINIGTQTWMAENLKVMHYRNGDPIHYVTSSQELGAHSSICCDYDFVPSVGIIYGKYYNWYAINDSRIIAPIGWHIPSDSDWIELTTYLGGPTVAGYKLREIGTDHWLLGGYSDNSSGFTALPGGTIGLFPIAIKYTGYWWSSTEIDTANAWYWSWDHNSIEPLHSCFKFVCANVRCVKD
jgi:uncharacterized protein (TIGR02145 family)